MNNERETENKSETVEQMFTRVLRERLATGVIERAVAENIDEMLKTVVRDALRSYGDIGKAVAEQFRAAIMPEARDLGDLPRYHHVVTQQIRGAVQRFYDERLRAAVDAEIAAIEAEMPSRVTLSDLLEKLAKQYKDAEGDDFESHELTLVIERDKNQYSGSVFHYVYLDAETRKDKYACRYRVGLHNGQVFTAHVRGADLKNSLALGGHGALERVILCLYALHGRVELDKGESAEDYETTVYGTWAD